MLGLDVDVSELLPTDSSDAGFDNIASALKVTPALLERYVTAAVRISALAVGDPNAEALEEILLQTKGYPYFLQEWGKHRSVVTPGPRNRA